jgi:hypothetical protein
MWLDDDVVEEIYYVQSPYDAENYSEDDDER